MLQPKRTKYRKAFKGHIHGVAKGGFNLDFGSYGLKALEPEQVPKRLDVTNRDLVVNENVPTPPNVIVRGNGGPPSTVTVVSDARPARDLGLNGDAINVFLPAGK